MVWDCVYPGRGLTHSQARLGLLERTPYDRYIDRRLPLTRMVKVRLPATWEQSVLVENYAKRKCVSVVVDEKRESMGRVWIRVGEIRSYSWWLGLFKWYLYEYLINCEIGCLRTDDTKRLPVLTSMRRRSLNRD